MKKNSVSEKKIVCIDFGLTILNSNLHHAAAVAGISPIATNPNGLIINNKVINCSDNPLYNKRILKNFTRNFISTPEHGIKNHNKLLEALQSVLQAGNEIAITSFSLYPDAIIISLEELGLTKKEIKNINIITGFPDKGLKESVGKNLHIAQAMQLAKINDFRNVILLDDDEKNIRAIVKLGGHGIIVPLGINPNIQYLEELINLAGNKEDFFTNKKQLSSLDSSKKDLKMPLPKNQLINTKRHVSKGLEENNNLLKRIGNPIKLDNFKEIGIDPAYIRKLIIADITPRIGNKMLNSFSMLKFVKDKNNNLLVQNVEGNHIKNKLTEIMQELGHKLYDRLNGMPAIIFTSQIDENKTKTDIKSTWYNKLYSLIHHSIEDNIINNTTKNNFNKHLGEKSKNLERENKSDIVSTNIIQNYKENKVIRAKRSTSITIPSSIKKL